MNSKQTAAVKRIEKVDPSATTKEVGDVVLISYVPRWEKGRMVSGTFRENPNPTRLTHAITVDGKLHGWGYGVKVKLPEGATITTAEDMATVLKARAEARKPEKVEAEVEAAPEPEVEVEAKPKTTPKKREPRKPRTGVVVSK